MIEHMMYHPLRDTLGDEDWSRIQHAIDTECFDDVTVDEIQAMHDALYDVIAGKEQTHYGVTTLQ